MRHSGSDQSRRRWYGGRLYSLRLVRRERQVGFAHPVVLEELAKEANPAEQGGLSRIERLLDGASDHIFIDPKDAKLLASLVSRYRVSIAQKIAPISDPFEQIERDFLANPDLNPTDAKYGKSLGWKFHCILDVEKAFDVSAREQEPVVLTWD